MTPVWSTLGVEAGQQVKKYSSTVLFMSCSEGSRSRYSSQQVREARAHGPHRLQNVSVPSEVHARLALSGANHGCRHLLTTRAWPAYAVCSAVISIRPTCSAYNATTVYHSLHGR